MSILHTPMSRIADMAEYSFCDYVIDGDRGVIQCIEDRGAAGRVTVWELPL